MKNKIILGAAAAVILIIGFIFMGSSDEDLIRKSLVKLEENLEKEGDEGVYTILSKSEKVTSLFTENCTIEIKTPRMVINGRKKLLQDVGSALKFVKKLSVSFHDITIEIKDEKSAATLMTATAEVPGEGGMNAVEIKMEWVKTEDMWLINTVRQMETFRKGSSQY